MGDSMTIVPAETAPAKGKPEKKRRRSWRRWVAWTMLVVVLLTGVVGAGLLWRRWSTRADRAEATYDAAMSAQAFPIAAAAIRKAATINENEPRYWLKLGRVQLAMGGLQDALNAYERVLDFDPENIEALQSSAELSAAGGSYDDARAHVATLLKLQPDDVRANIVQVAIAVRLRQFSDAVKLADQLIARGIQTDDVYVLKGRALSGLNNDKAAVALLEERDRQAPGSISILRELATVYSRLGNKTALTRTMARLAAIMPDNIDFALAGAKDLAAQGKGDAARAQADAAQARGAADPDIQLKVVDYWDEVGGRAEALAAARRAAAAGGDAVKIAIAQKLLDLGVPAEALALVKPFAKPEVSVTAENVTARTIYGNALLAFGRLGEARKIADDVLEFDDTNIQGLMLRTRLGIVTKRYNQALTDAQMLVNSDSRYEPGLLALGEVHALRGERTLADVSYSTARKLFPDSIAALDARADWLIRTNRAQEAVLMARDFLRGQQTRTALSAAIGICDRAHDPCAAALRRAPKPAAP